MPQLPNSNYKSVSHSFILSFSSPLGFIKTTSQASANNISIIPPCFKQSYAPLQLSEPFSATLHVTQIKPLSVSFIWTKHDSVCPPAAQHLLDFQTHHPT